MGGTLILSIYPLVGVSHPRDTLSTMQQEYVLRVCVCMHNLRIKCGMPRLKGGMDHGEKNRTEPMPKNPICGTNGHIA